MKRARFFVGLGSNLGNRSENLQEAVRRLGQQEGVELGSVSSCYETEPEGGPPQGKYLNAVLEGSTTLPARGLLRRLAEIETSMGRQRDTRWGPRTIDLDLLDYDGQREESPELQLPHPRLPRRLFVLVPLGEIGSGFVHPATGLGPQQMIERLTREHPDCPFPKRWRGPHDEIRGNDG